MILNKTTRFMSVIMAFVLIMACVVPTGAEIAEKLPEKNASLADLNEALNVEGGTLEFTTEEYPFAAIDDGERYYAQSTNYGIYDSSSLLKTTVTVSAGDVLSFDYLLVCEYGSVNFLSLYVVNEAGEEVRPFVTEESDGTWQTASYTFSAAGEYDLTWQYYNEYDGAGYACLDNIEIISTSDPDPTPTPAPPAPDLNEALNVEGGTLEFVSPDGDDYSFVAVNNGERYFAESTNSGVDMHNTRSTMRTTVSVSVGDVLSFDYFVSSERYCDFLYLYIDGLNDGAHIAEFSGTDMTDWDTCTYTFTEGGEYKIVWMYEKDGMLSYGEDLARIDNVELIDNPDPDPTPTTDPARDLNEALNVEGGSLEFTSDGEYPFIAVDDGERYYAESTNMGYDETSSIVRTTVTATAGEILSFDYFVSSEYDYDIFNVYIEGVEGSIFEISGVMGGWATFTYTIPADGEYTFVWEYSKDMSDNGGEDFARLDNIQILTTEVVLPGDVDGDGIVDSIDALLILRYAMGIIEEEDIDIENADVNEDDVIDALDALFVLRMSLGIE